MEGTSPYIQLLASVPAFAAFNTAQLQALYGCCALKVLAKGELASVAGQDIGELSIVVSGRVAGRGGRSYEAGRGETFEAQAFFNCTPAQATAVALRETVLLTLGREDLAGAFQASPDLIGTCLARMWTQESLPSRPPSPLSRLVVSAAGVEGRLEPGLKDALLAGLESVAEVRVLGRQSFGAGMRGGLALDSPEIAHWFQEQELEFDLTLIIADEADLDFAKEAIEEADGVLFIACGKDAGLSVLEKHALEARGAQNCRLVLQKGGSGPLKNAAEWIEPRRYGLVQAIDFALPDDVRLMGRAIAGKGHTIAVTSPGVYAAAIFGALQAVEEHGLPVVSLAAAGSAVLPAGLLACGKFSAGPAIFRELANPLLWKRSSRSEAGLYDPVSLDNFLVGALQGLEVPTAIRPFAAVSRSLSAGKPEVHRSGRLHGAVRAGIAPPGILPPLILDGGDILVSGECEIEALAAAAKGLTASPITLILADPPAIGNSPMSYRNLTGSTLFRLTQTVDKRVRLDTVLSLGANSRPCASGERSFAIPIPEGIMPMDWPQWSKLRDAAYEWALKELETGKLASDKNAPFEGA